MSDSDPEYMQEIEDFPSLTPSPEKPRRTPAASSSNVAPKFSSLDLPSFLSEKTVGQEITIIGEGLKDFSTLQLSNKLTVLQLHGNGITSMRELEICTSLIEIDLSSNNITSITGLGVNHANLKVLDLSCNRLQNLKGLAGLVSLEKLLVPFNKIKTLEELNVLWGKDSKLVELDVRDNRITDLEQLSALRGLSALRTIKFGVGKNKNPVCGHANYRFAVLQSAPLGLQKLDGTDIDVAERDNARHAALLAFSKNSSSSYRPQQSKSDSNQKENVDRSYNVSGSNTAPPNFLADKQNANSSKTTNSNTTPVEEIDIDDLGFLPNPKKEKIDVKKGLEMKNALEQLAKGYGELEKELDLESVLDDEDVSLKEDMNQIQLAMAKLEADLNLLSKSHTIALDRAVRASNRLSKAKLAQEESIVKLAQWQKEEEKIVSALPSLNLIDLSASPFASVSLPTELQAKQEVDEIILEDAPVFGDQIRHDLHSSPIQHSPLPSCSRMVGLDARLSSLSLSPTTRNPSQSNLSYEDKVKENEILDEESIRLVERNAALEQAVCAQQETNLALQNDLDDIRNGIRLNEELVRARERQLAEIAGRLAADLERSTSTRHLQHEVERRIGEQSARRQERIMAAEQSKHSAFIDLQNTEQEIESIDREVQNVLSEIERLESDISSNRLKQEQDEIHAEQQEQIRQQEKIQLKQAVSEQTINLENELKELLTTAHNRVELLEQQLSGAESKRVQQESVNLRLEKKAAEVNRDVEESKAGVSILQRQITEFEEKSRRLKRDIASAKAVTNQQTRDLEDVRSQHQLANSRSTNIIPLTELDDVRSQCRSAEQTVRELSEKCENAKESARHVTLDADEKRKEVNDLNNQIATANSAALAVEREMSASLDRTKDLKARLEKKDRDLREAESAQAKRNQDWQDVLDKELQITQEARQRFESEQKVIAKLEDQGAKLREDLRRRDDDLGRVKQELFELTDGYKKKEIDAEIAQAEFLEQGRAEVATSTTELEVIANKQIRVLELRFANELKEKRQQEQALAAQLEIANQKVKTTENEITIVEQEMKKKEARLALRMRGVHEHLAGLRDSTA